LPLPKRILLVDDQGSLLYAMEQYLDACGFDVDAALALADARNLLHVSDYDVVVTDLRLTATHPAEGLDLVEQIRNRGLGCRIVVLTGNSSAEHESRARELGVDRFLTKPVPLAVLAGIVSELTGD
jgi:DNA-binding response OmpR family regulator